MNATTISTVSSVFQNMLKVSLVALFLVVLNSCSSDSDNGSPAAVTPPVASGTTAPEFSLTSLDSKTVKLSDYKNKVVTLFFFGNECPSCKAVGQKICMELGGAYGSRSDYQILGIDQWDGNAAKVQTFKTVTNIAFPLLLNGSSVAASYKTTYDRIVVIDKTGKIMFSGTQGASSDIAAAKAKIDELLK
jgi:peroxiredoxin